MRSLTFGLILSLAACTGQPEADPSVTHTCVTAPSGLVECSEEE